MPEDEFPVESEVVVQQEQLAVWRVPVAMWPLGLGLTFGVVLAREADLPAHLKVVVKQEWVAATAPGAEVPLQSEVVLHQEVPFVRRAFRLMSAPGLPLVLEVAMVVQVDFPLELPVMVPPGGQEVALRVGLRLILKIALVIEVQLPPGKAVVV